MVTTAVKTKILSLVSFWILGLCNNFGYVVMLSSAHDILKSKTSAPESNTTISLNSTDGFARECNHLSTGVILLADIIPGLLIKSISPFFGLYVHRRLALCIGLTIASFITVARAETEIVAAIGVALTSMSSGLGESTLLSYMTNYQRNIIAFWASGTGAAGILGALTYTILTGIFELSPSTTLYFMLIVPILMAVSFWLLLEHPCEDTTQVVSQSLPEDSNMEIESFSVKLSYIPSLFKYMIPIGLVFFFEYLINQGLFELVYFENIWLTHAEQYRWYQVLYQLGVFVSRTSVNLFLIEKIWILAMLQGFNVVFFLAETLYSFTPNIFIIFIMIAYEGLLGGSAYSNTYYSIMKNVPKEKQEFSMAMTAFSDATGIALSGFLAIPLHNQICHLPK
ncbi:Major facilitator superfamily domain,Batten's disease protein Cln3, subgroup,Batten's disease protein [Cinara cedri]|uniref:Battenin n=1 Tax=Cinara cedri TaxID=506608 RepID=A0A5E4NTJ1_9HEMI|nr:Major facilitator superfamily domain,Batten's disease protein Cln3, subgroup,Batten's disease protein [Cinara cedri]